MALSITGMVGMAGLAIDTVRAYFVQSALSSAIDGAVMAAARVPEPEMQRVAEAVFRVNFPQGLMTSRSRSHDPLKYDAATRTVSLAGTASLETFFMKALGQGELHVSAAAAAERPASGGDAAASVILMDQTALSASAPAVAELCGDHAVQCVNQDIAAPGLRRLLFERPVERPAALDIRLQTGDTGNGGLFRFLNPDTQSNLRDRSSFSVADFVFSAGAAANAVHLDQVADIAPLRAPEIRALAGQNVCAVVFRDDIRTEADDHSGKLSGDTLGLTAFRVAAVEDVQPGASRLPDLTVGLLPADQVSVYCAQASQPQTGTSRVPVLVR